MRMMRLLGVLVACVTLVVTIEPTTCNREFDVISNVLGRSLALLVGQKFSSDKEVPKEFGKYEMRDKSNEHMGRATPQQMISRAGFRYVNHYVVSDDGYVTQLVRIVNPLADQSQLKQPPVVLLQGGITDITIWIWNSISQHHPEKYPRTPQDGPITSWNRSLAFTLSNNGYDVWLVSHRGSNEQNWGHINLRDKRRLPGRQYMASNGYNETYLAGLSAEHEQRDIGDTLRFWDFSFDEVANYETPRHLDYILSHTKAPNITLVPMSFSSIYAAMALVRHPQYLSRLHNVVVVGPIMNMKGSNRYWMTFYSSACKMLPVDVGTVLLTEIFGSKTIRGMNSKVGQVKNWQYSVLAQIYAVLMGPSSKYQTFYESSVIGHVLMPTGFKMIKHWCQIATRGEYKSYDYGRILNKKYYGKYRTPSYDLNVLNFGDWMVVSGENDIVATVSSVEHYISHIKPRPLKNLKIKGYNHLDLWAAADNDVKVNLPVLQFIEDRHIRHNSLIR